VCPGRDVDVLGVDAFLGQQRRQLVQQLVRHAGLNWISGSPAGGGSGVRRRMSGMRTIIAGPLADCWRAVMVHRPSRRSRARRQAATGGIAPPGSVPQIKEITFYEITRISQTRGKQPGTYIGIVPRRAPPAGAARRISTWRLDRGRLAAVTAAAAPGVPVVEAGVIDPWTSTGMAVLRKAGR